MVSREHLKKFSDWAGFIGVINIILGIIQIVFGIFAYFIGAIPGVITLILGLKLREAATRAGEALYADEDNCRLDMVFTNLNAYLKIQGVLYIISIAAVIIGFLSGLG